MPIETAEQQPAGGSIVRSEASKTNYDERHFFLRLSEMPGVERLQELNHYFASGRNAAEFQRIVNVRKKVATRRAAG
jgi:hypothetical protein